MIAGKETELLYEIILSCQVYAISANREKYSVKEVFVMN